LQMHIGGGNFKKQMKKANESGAAFALLLGEDELNAGQVSVKPLRGQGEQLTLDQDKVAAWLSENL